MCTVVRLLPGVALSNDVSDSTAAATTAASKNTALGAMRSVVVLLGIELAGTVSKLCCEIVEGC